MELKITNPIAPTFNESVGISEERANELSGKLDAMNKRFQGHAVRTCDVFNEVTLFCDNLEEVVYCTINHCNFMVAKYGIIYCPPKDKTQAKAQ